MSFLHDDHDSTGGGDDSTHADCDYIEVLTDPITVNLAGLDTTLTELLGTLELPQGDYTHLALHVADGWVVTQAGDSVEADVPGNNDLLKVIFPFTVSDGQVTEIVIVFDLDKSVVEAPPGSGNFKIKPVLHGAWGSHDHEHDSQFGHDDGENDGGKARQRRRQRRGQRPPGITPARSDTEVDGAKRTSPVFPEADATSASAVFLVGDRYPPGWVPTGGPPGRFTYPLRRRAPTAGSG